MSPPRTAILSGSTAIVFGNPVERPFTAANPGVPDCKGRGWYCSSTTAFVVIRWITLAFLIAFALCLLHYLWQGGKDVKKRPYNAYRFDNAFPAHLNYGAHIDEHQTIACACALNNPAQNKKNLLSTDMSSEAPEKKGFQ